MDQPTSPARTAIATPWHLWVVGILGLLWNGFGAYDYLMSHLQPEAYPRSMGMTDAQLANLAALPAWVTAAWAIGAWGALLGSALLLMRRRVAYPVFIVSLAALVLTLVHQYALENAGPATAQAMVMSAVILAATVFFALYARALGARDVLR